MCRIHAMRFAALLGVLSALAVTAAASPASAQYGGYGGYSGGYSGYGGGSYGGYAPVAPSEPRSTALEIGYLYTTAATYGVGVGIWFDAEVGIEDPGLRFIAPAVLGVGMPIGVYFLDSPPMPRGMPSAIATGMIIGAGEGLGIVSYQHVTATAKNEWSFTALARAEVIGGLLGGAAGYAFYRLGRPSPKTNIFVASAAAWGTAIGDAFGGGASSGDWGHSNDTIGLGGLIGFNAGLVTSAALSTVWIPSWNQIVWMWAGFGIGIGASAPVYLFYAGSDKDPRVGLIVQGIGATLGLGVGALVGKPDGAGSRGYETESPRPAFARVLSAGPMAVPGGGMGAQVMGELW